MAAILFSKWPPLWQLFRNKMLKQIRSLVQTSISIFFSDINYIDKKIDQIILEQVWGILWKNGSHFEQNGHHFLCRQKNITSNRTCTTLWYCLQNFVRISFLVQKYEAFCVIFPYNCCETVPFSNSVEH